MASCESGFLDWVKALIPVVSWWLVIRGWEIARADNDRRELRKEVRGLIDSVLDQMDRLEEQSHRYFTDTDSVSGAALGASIRSGLKQVGVDCRYIKDASSGSINCDQLVVALRQAITSSSFDSASRTPISEEDLIFEQIRAAILDLRSYLQGRFLTLYKAPTQVSYLPGKRA